MAKPILYLSIFVGLLIGMIGFNALFDPLSDIYQEEKCTRYCHNHPCTHSQLASPQTPYAKFFVKVYVLNIQWLKKNPLGLSYKEMNLLLYVCLFPLFVSFLLWALVRRRKKYE